MVSQSSIAALKSVWGLELQRCLLNIFITVLATSGVYGSVLGMLLSLPCKLCLTVIFLKLYNWGAGPLRSLRLLWLQGNDRLLVFPLKLMCQWKAQISYIQKYFIWKIVIATKATEIHWKIKQVKDDCINYLGMSRVSIYFILWSSVLNNFLGTFYIPDVSHCIQGCFLYFLNFGLKSYTSWSLKVKSSMCHLFHLVSAGEKNQCRGDIKTWWIPLAGHTTCAVSAIWAQTTVSFWNSRGHAKKEKI